MCNPILLLFETIHMMKRGKEYILVGEKNLYSNRSVSTWVPLSYPSNGYPPLNRGDWNHFFFAEGNVRKCEYFSRNAKKRGNEYSNALFELTKLPVLT